MIVLGTPYLAQLPATFKFSSLRLPNERLRGWKPRIIAIEALSGTQCALMRQYPRHFQQSAISRKILSVGPAPARAATGLDVAAATAEIDHLLANWPTDPTSDQRRRLAALFFAGGEAVSALVQWLRLPEAEWHTGDGLDTNLVAALKAQRGGQRARGDT